MNLFYYILFSVIGLALVFVLKEFFFPAKENKSFAVKRKIISSSTPRKGVQVDVMQEGTGQGAGNGDRVTVHYQAFLTNGTKVDSSYDKGETFSFQMGRRQVIPGWEAGMLGMKVGEKRKFTIAPDQAYGSKGKANVPPNATIIFEVELLKKVP